MAGAEGLAKKSDLGVRTLSAIVMVVVAGGSLWLGGWVWVGFVLLVSLGVLWEWRGLIVGITRSPVRRGLGNAAGLIYVGGAAVFLSALRTQYFSNNPSNMHSMGMWQTLVLLLVVIGVDVGAYFTGRTIGGPKIAPSISPSKTWSGLFGGMLGAGLVLIVWQWVYVTFLERCDYPGICDITSATVGVTVIMGILAAVVAQAGDFLESWMKRKAGVKDSGNMIPGHGGLLDRIDGLLAVTFVIGVAAAIGILEPSIK
jgi:phosphatidate cytidylyltransferase